MTAAEKSATNQQRSDRAIELRVAARLENLAICARWSGRSALSRTSTSTPLPTCAWRSTRCVPG